VSSETPDLPRSSRPSVIMRVVLFLCGACQRQIETQIVCEFEGNAAVFGQVHCVENLKESIALRSAQAPWRDSFCRVGGCNPLHYELEQISKTEIPRKTKTTLRHQNHPRRSFPRWLKTSDPSTVLLYKAKYLLLKLQHGNGRVVSNSQFQRS
jgi:hypothetical protein